MLGLTYNFGTAVNKRKQEKDSAKTEQSKELNGYKNIVQLAAERKKIKRRIVSPQDHNQPFPLIISA